MRTEVVRSECMIDAYISEGMFHVLHSTKVKERHRIYRPVKERLARNCTALVSQADFEDNDEQWVGGSYTWKMIQVYDSCPGSSKEHDCCKEVTSGRIPISIAG